MQPFPTQIKKLKAYTSELGAELRDYSEKFEEVVKTRNDLHNSNDKLKRDMFNLEDSHCYSAFSLLLQFFLNNISIRRLIRLYKPLIFHLCWKGLQVFVRLVSTRFVIIQYFLQESKKFHESENAE